MQVDREGPVEVLGRRIELDGDMEPHEVPCHVVVYRVKDASLVNGPVTSWVWQAQLKGAHGWSTSDDALKAILQACSRDPEKDAPEWARDAAEQAQELIFGVDRMTAEGGT